MQRANKRAARLAATAAAIIAVSSPVAAAGYQASTPAPSNAPLTGETGIAIRYDSGAGATPSAQAFLALQLNLCDSGFATDRATTAIGAESPFRGIPRHSGHWRRPLSR